MSNFSENEIKSIREKYLMAKPPQQVKELAWLVMRPEQSFSADRPNRIIGEKSSRTIYECTLGHKIQERQPPLKYRIAFVKYIIKQLETARSSDQTDGNSSCDPDADDSLELELWYNVLASLENKYQVAPSEPYFRIYEICDTVSAKIYENENAFVQNGTTGLMTWEASLELAKWMAYNSSFMEGANWALELGCGCGLLAISAVQLLPHLQKYIATDGSTTALSNFGNNLRDNLSTANSRKLETMEVNWEKDLNMYKQLITKFTADLGQGLLLGADIVFDANLTPSLVRLIDVFLQSHENSSAIISCTSRNEETLKSFLYLIGIFGVILLFILIFMTLILDS